MRVSLAHKWFICQVSLWSLSPGSVWGHETGELVLSSGVSGFAVSLKGAPTAAWRMGLLLWKGTWSHRQILFSVCVLFPILVNQSIKPLFYPLFVCAASQTPSLSTGTVLSTSGAPVHTGKSGPFNVNQRVINPPLTLYRASRRLESEMVVKLLQSESYYWYYL